jgi:modification methylase
MTIDATIAHRLENQVFIGDSRDMSIIPDESVHLVVTSPPYFSIKDYSKDGYQAKAHSERESGQLGDIGQFDEFIRQLLDVWRECERVLVPNGKLIINTPLVPMLKSEMNTHENRHIFDLNAEIQTSILNGLSDIHLLDTYIWDRTNPTKKLMFGSYPHPSNFYAQNTIEFVTVYVKRGKSRKVDAAVKARSKLTQQQWVEYTKQVWNIPIPNKSDIAFGVHSALMPEEIARRCIALYSFVDDTVLDPFTGSGTTLKVAKEMDRKFIGFELVASYSDTINAKIGSKVCIKVPKRIAVERSEISFPSNLRNKVVQQEALAYLSKIPSNSVQLICTDPPYNLDKADWDTWPTDGEFLSFTKIWLNEAFRVLQPGGRIFVFNTPRNTAHILVHAELHGMKFENWITWDKRDGFAPSKRRFVSAQESILFLSKPGRKMPFNADLVRVPYDSKSRIEAAKTKGIIKNGKRWYPNALGKLCTDVWHFASARHSLKVNGRTVKSIHPTEKPIEMIERIVLAASNEGDLVLDIFLGTGTTAVAAKRLGRDFAGCDIDATYVSLAKKRLDEIIVK